MRLGATVTTWSQNKHQANGKLILQNQRRPNRFNQMLRSWWLVFLMLMELCTRNLFLLDQLWINNFIWRCWKDYAILYGKNDQKCGAAVIGSFTMTVTPHHPHSPDLVPCYFFLFPRMKFQMKGKCSAHVSEVIKKTLEVLNNISTKEFRKCFQQGEKWYKCIESKGEHFEGD